MKHIISGSNAADIASKHWTHKSAWPLIKPLFKHEGDTGELHTDDVKSDNSSSERGVLECDRIGVLDGESSEHHCSLKHQDGASLVAFLLDLIVVLQHQVTPGLFLIPKNRVLN